MLTHNMPKMNFIVILWMYVCRRRFSESVIISHVAEGRVGLDKKSAGPCLSGAYGCGDRMLICCSAVAVSCSAVAVSCSGIVAVADSRSAICNLLLVGPGNRPDHLQGTALLGFLLLPRASQNHMESACHNSSPPNTAMEAQ